jgi:hypothetical protein
MQEYRRFPVSLGIIRLEIHPIDEKCRSSTSGGMGFCKHCFQPLPPRSANAECKKKIRGKQRRWPRTPVGARRAFFDFRLAAAFIIDYRTAV